MRNVKFLGLLVGGVVLAAACGGQPTTTQAGNGGTGNSAGNGGNGNSAGNGGSGNNMGGGGSGNTGGNVGCTTAAMCDDSDACTIDDCVAGSCSNTAVVVDDNDLCTTDTCDSVTGVAHTPVNIDDNDECTDDACDPLTGVSHTAVIIDDGDACTDDSCDAILGVIHDPVDPNDGNACTTDTCDALTGVANTPIVPMDNNICTINTCDPAIGPIFPGEYQVFFEDFSDNSAGWTLGAEWEIGPALASPPFNAYDFGWSNVPLTDPDTDHTGTADNGIAGVVIGGNANPVLHPYSYIESPVVDISSVPSGANVEMRFWRWLNSDYDPYMHNTVEVFDGNAWVTLPGWPTVGFPLIMDTPPIGNGWFLMSYDVTAYANANFRMRWGFDITSGGVYTIGSWNLDDVELAYVPYAPSSDQCQIESCSPQFGTVLSPYPNNDNNACTTDVCDPQRGPRHEKIDTEYLYSTFDNGSGGWTVQGPWAIGNAVAYNPPLGTCQNDANPSDPGTDAAAGGGNGVAGTVLGGPVNGTAVSGPFYLTSPVMNTLNTPSGGLTLEFYRWLNIDIGPTYMIGLVQVYNGTSWNTIYSNPNSETDDAAWTLQSYDISAYKAANMQVRFSIQVVSTGAWDNCGGWNIDEVRVFDPGCP